MCGYILLCFAECYFNFYRFGSTSQSLFQQNELYGSEAFTKAKEYAKVTDVDTGGTEILEPPESILSSPPHRDSLVNCLCWLMKTSQIPNNWSAKMRTTPEYFLSDQVTVQADHWSMASWLAETEVKIVKQGQVLEDKVGRQLMRALQPAVLNGDVVWEGTKTLQQVPTRLPPIFCGDRQLVCVLFEK